MASCSTSSDIFGWDLMVKSVETDLKTPEDVLLCFAHLILVNHGFRCIGLGESKVYDGNEPKSEALPKDWAQAQALRYSFQGRLYNLKSTKLNTGIMINLLRVDERSTSLVELENSSVATTKALSLDQMIPNHSALVDLVKKQLIDKVIVSKKSRDTSCQTDPQRQSFTYGQPVGVGGPSGIGPVGPQRYGSEPIRPVGVGEIDLNPFGRNPMPNIIMPPQGGGMLYEPPRMPHFPGPNMGVPPGSLPPGARFDPFRPPDINRPPRRFGPDNDEFPPPGYDDMFM